MAGVRSAAIAGANALKSAAQKHVQPKKKKSQATNSAKSKSISAASKLLKGAAASGALGTIPQSLVLGGAALAAKQKADAANNKKVGVNTGAVSGSSAAADALRKTQKAAAEKANQSVPSKSQQLPNNFNKAASTLTEAAKKTAPRVLKRPSLIAPTIEESLQERLVSNPLVSPETRTLNSGRR